MDTNTLLSFTATFFLVSLTPGMCMTLALSLGMSVGYRRALPMMAGELLGLAAICLCSGLGLAGILLHHTTIFQVVKILGSLYLFFLAVQMWRTPREEVQPPDEPAAELRRANSLLPRNLFLQGLITAISNPKAWAFMVSLLPTFLSPQRELLPQLSLMLGLILGNEFLCMSIYALGGRSFRHLIRPHWLRRAAACLLFAAGIRFLLV